MNHWIASLCLVGGAALAVAIIPRIAALVAPPAPPSGRSRRLVAQRWQSRSIVLGPCLMVGLAITALPARSFYSIDAWLWSLLGPFAELGISSPAPLPLIIAHGCITFFGMLVHPIWPDVVAGCITILASAWWFMLGLAFTYSSV